MTLMSTGCSYQVVEPATSVKEAPLVLSSESLQNCAKETESLPQADGYKLLQQWKQM